MSRAGNETSGAQGCLQARVIANLRSMVAVQIEGSTGYEKAFAPQSLPLLVAGDRVTCQYHDSSLRIVDLVPRNSVLERSDRHSVKPLAANLTDLGIVSANPPGIDTLLIDQFCLAAYRAGVGALIIINKTDRMSSAERESAEQIAQIYRSIGHTAVLIDTKSDDGMEELVSELPGRSLTLVGASGVGKSSIVQRLLPDRDLRIGAVSEATGLGAHTTSVTYLYSLPGNGSIIDSPGVRQYSVAHLNESIVREGFHELAEAAVKCRFGNCRHIVEPDCAVLQGVADGSIAQWRYANYVKLVNN